MSSMKSATAFLVLSAFAGSGAQTISQPGASAGTFDGTWSISDKMPDGSLRLRQIRVQIHGNSGHRSLPLTDMPAMASSCVQISEFRSSRSSSETIKSSSLFLGAGWSPVARTSK